MKRLAVLRHAHAEPGDWRLPDFDRELDARGRREAERVGRALRDRGVSFDRAVTSSARRAAQTVEQVQRAFETPFPVAQDRRIYDADTDALLALIHELDNSAASVLLVGHNPTLQRLILDLSRPDERGLRAAVEAKLSPATLAVIELEIASWDGVGPGRGAILDLILPDDLG